MSFGLGRAEAKMAPIETNQGGNNLRRYIPRGKRRPYLSMSLPALPHTVVFYWESCVCVGVQATQVSRMGARPFPDARFW